MPAKANLPAEDLKRVRVVAEAEPLADSTRELGTQQPVRPHSAPGGAVPMIRQLFRDAAQLTEASGYETWSRAILLDSFSVTALTRAREAMRRSHIPLLNRVLRLTQTTVYGVDIGNQVELGNGVYFVHPLGTVIGGTSRIGDRVKFMGSNTVGTAKDNGYPVIENDVIVGSGARILGPIRIGAGAVIGANAVVLSDVPPGAVAVGIPARILAPRATTELAEWALVIGRD